MAEMRTLTVAAPQPRESTSQRQNDSILSLRKSAISTSSGDTPHSESSHPSSSTKLSR